MQSEIRSPLALCFLPSLRGLPRRFQALLRIPPWPGASLHWHRAHVHMARNMSPWGVDSSAQCLNSVQDWEGNPLLICSWCKAHRSKHVMQGENDSTSWLGLQNLTAKSLWRDSLSLPAHLPCFDECSGACLLVLASGFEQLAFLSRQLICT